MVFKSKIDLHLALMLIAAVAFPLVLGIMEFYQGQAECWVAFAGVFLILSSYGLIFPCKYTLHEDHLHVKCGWSTNEYIRYQDIIHIEESASLWSSPALSLQRLAIKTRKGETIISPKDRDRFLLLINEKIGQNKDRMTT